MRGPTFTASASGRSLYALATLTLLDSSPLTYLLFTHEPHHVARLTVNPPANPLQSIEVDPERLTLL